MKTQSEALGEWIKAEIDAHSYLEAIPISAIVSHAMHARTLAGTRLFKEHGQHWIELTFYDGSAMTLEDEEGP